jgi:hypothetical protein
MPQYRWTDWHSLADRNPGDPGSKRVTGVIRTVDGRRETRKTIPPSPVNTPPSIFLLPLERNLAPAHGDTL